MKKIYHILVAGIASLSLVSCIGNLNTLPLNEYDATSEAAYVNEDSYLSGLAYINAYYSFVSQNNAGASDLAFDDAGQSELLRQWLVLNDLPTGAQDIGWGDSYIAPLETHTWTTADNNAIIILGAAIKDDMEDEIAITVIAAGFEKPVGRKERHPFGDEISVEIHEKICAFRTDQRL